MVLVLYDMMNTVDILANPKEINYGHGKPKMSSIKKKKLFNRLQLNVSDFKSLNNSSSDSLLKKRCPGFFTKIPKIYLRRLKSEERISSRNALSLLESHLQYTQESNGFATANLCSSNTLSILNNGKENGVATNNLQNNNKDIPLTNNVGIENSKTFCTSLSSKLVTDKDLTRLKLTLKNVKPNRMTVTAVEECLQIQPGVELQQVDMSCNLDHQEKDNMSNGDDLIKKQTIEHIDANKSPLEDINTRQDETQENKNPDITDVNCEVENKSNSNDEIAVNENVDYSNGELPVLSEINESACASSDKNTFPPVLLPEKNFENSENQQIQTEALTQDGSNMPDTSNVNSVCDTNIPVCDDTDFSELKIYVAERISSPTKELTGSQISDSNGDIIQWTSEADNGKTRDYDDDVEKVQTEQNDQQEKASEALADNIDGNQAVLQQPVVNQQKPARIHDLTQTIGNMLVKQEHRGVRKSLDQHDGYDSDATVIYDDEENRNCRTKMKIKKTRELLRQKSKSAQLETDRQNVVKTPETMECLESLYPYLCDNITRPEDISLTVAETSDNEETRLLIDEKPEDKQVTKSDVPKLIININERIRKKKQVPSEKKRTKIKNGKRIKNKANSAIKLVSTKWDQALTSCDSVVYKDLTISRGIVKNSVKNKKSKTPSPKKEKNERKKKHESQDIVMRNINKIFPKPRRKRAKDEDDLPTILPPKRRRNGKTKVNVDNKTVLDRIKQEFPRSNWLETKYTDTNGNSDKNKSMLETNFYDNDSNIQLSENINLIDHREETDNCQSFQMQSNFDNGIESDGIPSIPIDSRVTSDGREQEATAESMKNQEINNEPFDVSQNETESHLIESDTPYLNQHYDDTNGEQHITTQKTVIELEKHQNSDCEMQLLVHHETVEVCPETSTEVNDDQGNTQRVTESSVEMVTQDHICLTNVSIEHPSTETSYSPESVIDTGSDRNKSEEKQSTEACMPLDVFQPINCAISNRFSNSAPIASSQNEGVTSVINYSQTKDIRTFTNESNTVSKEGDLQSTVEIEIIQDQTPCNPNPLAIQETQENEPQGKKARLSENGVINPSVPLSPPHVSISSAFKTTKPGLNRMHLLGPEVDATYKEIKELKRRVEVLNRESKFMKSTLKEKEDLLRSMLLSSPLAPTKREKAVIGNNSTLNTQAANPGETKPYCVQNKSHPFLKHFDISNPTETLKLPPPAHSVPKENTKEILRAIEANPVKFPSNIKTTCPYRSRQRPLSPPIRFLTNTALSGQVTPAHSQKPFENLDKLSAKPGRSKSQECDMNNIKKGNSFRAPSASLQDNTPINLQRLRNETAITTNTTINVSDTVQQPFVIQHQTVPQTNFTPVRSVTMSPNHSAVTQKSVNLMQKAQASPVAGRNTEKTIQQELSEAIKRRQKQESKEQDYQQFRITKPTNLNQRPHVMPPNHMISEPKQNNMQANVISPPVVCASHRVSMHSLAKTSHQTPYPGELLTVLQRTSQSVEAFNGRPMSGLPTSMQNFNQLPHSVRLIGAATVPSKQISRSNETTNKSTQPVFEQPSIRNHQGQKIVMGTAQRMQAMPIQSVALPIRSVAMPVNHGGRMPAQATMRPIHREMHQAPKIFRQPVPAQMQQTIQGNHVILPVSQPRNVQLQKPMPSTQMTTERLNQGPQQIQQVVQPSNIQHREQTNLPVQGVISGRNLEQQQGQALVQPEANTKNQHIFGSCVLCGKFSLYLCSTCQDVWYCSQQCQLKHWTTHQHECKYTASK